MPFYSNEPSQINAIDQREEKINIIRGHILIDYSLEVSFFNEKSLTLMEHVQFPISINFQVF